MLIRLPANGVVERVAPRAFLLVAGRKRARSDAFHLPLSRNRISAVRTGRFELRHSRAIAIAMPMPPPTHSDAIPRFRFLSSKM